MLPLYIHHVNIILTYHRSCCIIHYYIIQLLELIIGELEYRNLEVDIHSVRFMKVLVSGSILEILACDSVVSF